MNRRDLLKFLILSSFAYPGNVLWAQSAPPHRKFIDIHCHFFNASDLPVRGFVQIVVLEDYATAQNTNHPVLSAIPLEVWKGLAAKLVDFIIKSRSPTPNQELQCLRRSGACRDFRARSAAIASEEESATPRATGKRELLKSILEDHYAEQDLSAKSLAPAEKTELADTDAFVNFVLSEMKAAGRTAADVSAKSLQNKALRSPVLDQIADFIASGLSTFSRYFEWGKVLSDYRNTIADTYEQLYDPGHNNLILATPALVDYNFWLDDQSPSALQEQIELMSVLSLRRAQPMHCYAPFDPLRQIRQDGAALKLVQNAITRFGFIGVKLYSPMGFRPFGNTDTTLTFPPYADRHEPGFGAHLDQALLDLYQWCHEEDVPILAHTLNSQAAGENYGRRAEPNLCLPFSRGFPISV